jgi:hypothetical protein
VDVVSVRLQLGYGHMLQRNRQEFVAFNVSNEALEAAAGTVREKAASELHTRGLQRFICLPRLSRLFDWS